MTNEGPTIDIEAARSVLLGPGDPNSGGLMDVLRAALPTHPPTLNRKPRSDKGVPKPKKPIENKGVLLPEQVIHIDTLLRGVIVAEAALRQAEKEYEDFLDALTIKK